MRARASRSAAFSFTFGLALAVPAFAQEAPPAEAAEPARAEAIEELFVTITKRDVSLQDVPASVTALSPETLELANIESASDIATLIPNVVTKGESRTGNFSIRGVSESFSSQSPVAYHVNGLFKLSIDSLLGQYYDLESIQLVRGPAGTVYGRNATAGAIDFRWAKPHAEYEAQADALYGNYHHVQLRGVLNAPLFGEDDERLMARLVVQRDLRDGYMKDLTRPSRRDDPHNADEWYSRLTLRSLPSDDVELIFRGYYNQSDADPYVSRPLVGAYTQGFLDTRQFDDAGALDAENFGVIGFDPYHGYALLVSDLTGVIVANSNGDPNVASLHGLANLICCVPRNRPPRMTLAEAAEQVVLGLVIPGVPGQPGLLADPSQVGVSALPIPTNPLHVRSSAYQRHQSKLRVYGTEGSLGWDFAPAGVGPLRLDFHFGFEHVDFDQAVDADGSELPIIDVFRPHRDNLYTGELRLTSQGEGAVDWIAGLFYFRHTADQGVDEIIIPFGTILSESYQVSTGFAPFMSVAVRPFELLSDAPKIDLELFGGWRWNRDSLDLQSENLQHPSGPSGLQFEAATFTENTWEAGIRWRPSENHMLYAKFAKGYKAGLLEADNQTAAIRSVDPELIRAWEAGVKSTLWDGRLQLSLTGFLSDYTDLQVPQIVGLSQFTLNAAAATIKGVEVEALAQPVDGLSIQASAGFLDARFDKFCSDDAAQNLAVSDPGCPAVNPLFPWQGQSNLAGKHLEDAPRWKASLFANYRIELGARGSLTPVVKFTWTDHYELRPYALSADRVDAYTRSDVRLVWRSASERFSVEAFCENLENEIVFARNVTTGEFSGSFPASVGLIPPRTYGVRIGFDWRASE
jgi:outer membrane receptor protein involved in Fe transport